MPDLNRAVFLDRDGVINEENGFVTKFDELKIIFGVVEAIKILNKEGFKVIVITNQPQVARGLCSEKDIENLHQELGSQLESLGAHIDGFYFCPHHPETHHQDIPSYAQRYRISCNCRKPAIGLVEKAAQDFSINLKKSFFVGDRTVDVKTGADSGCSTFLVRTGFGGSDKKYEYEPDFRVSDVLEAAKIIEKMNSLTTIILAGGRGERLRPLTDSMPKPMMLIKGKPLLEHLIELNKAAGVNNILISGHYLFEKIKNYFNDGTKWGVQIEYIDDGDVPLGSAGALKKAEPLLSDDFIVMNGDLMTNFDLRELITLHFKKNSIASIVVRETDHPEDSDLITLDENNRALEFISKHNQDKIGNIANVGLFIFKKDILRFAPKIGNLEYDILQTAIKNSYVACYLNKKYFMRDIGSLAGYTSAKDFFF